MSRKLIAVSLALLMVLSLAACSTPKQELKDPVTFYYRRSEPVYGQSDGVVAPEQREAQGHKDDLDWLLAEYFSGCTSEELHIPFPKGTSVTDWSIADNTLTVVLSENFGQLSGVDLTVACSCISMTFLELAEVEAVEICAENSRLNGEESLLFTADTFHLSDYDSDQTQQKMTVYYLDSQYRYVVGKTVTVSLSSVEDIYRYLFERMLYPPEDSGLLSPVPKETQLLGITVRDGVCSVDLSEDFVRNAPQDVTCQRSMLLAIVNTLTGLSEVDRVELYQNGELLSQFGSLTLASSLEYDASAIGPVMTGLNEMDLTLYLANGSAGLLAPVPVRIRRTVGLSEAELAIQALFGTESKNGFDNLIPEDTKVLDINVSNERCTVNLSADFLSDENTLAAAYSVAATLCGLDGISEVLILVDGAVPEILGGPLVPDSGWFLQ